MTIVQPMVKASKEHGLFLWVDLLPRLFTSRDKKANKFCLVNLAFFQFLQPKNALFLT